MARFCEKCRILKKKVIPCRLCRKEVCLNCFDFTHNICSDCATEQFSLNYLRIPAFIILLLIMSLSCFATYSQAPASYNLSDNVDDVDTAYNGVHSTNGMSLATGGWTILGTVIQYNNSQKSLGNVSLFLFNDNSGDNEKAQIAFTDTTWTGLIGYKWYLPSQTIGANDELTFRFSTTDEKIFVGFIATASTTKISCYGSLVSGKPLMFDKWLNFTLNITTDHIDVLLYNESTNAWDKICNYAMSLSGLSNIMLKTVTGGANQPRQYFDEIKMTKKGQNSWPEGPASVITLTRVAQSPQGISTTNIFSPFTLNISYDIVPTGTNTDNNTVSIFFNYSYFINGTSFSGYTPKSYSSKNNTWYNFVLYDNNVYPATYNYNESIMEITPHNTDSASSNTVLKVQILNVSSKRFNILEMMVNSSGVQTEDFYYCNLTYSIGSPATDTNCFLLKSYLPIKYNHTHSQYSSHQIVPFVINSTGFVGSVKATPISYFLAVGNWNYYSINLSMRDSFFVSSNTGNAYTTITGKTLDSHLHQFDENNTFSDYACASDISAVEYCSGTNTQNITVTHLPPSSVFVNIPNKSAENIFSYVANGLSTIPINYTISIPFGNFTIDHYSLELVDNSIYFDALNNSVFNGTLAVVYNITANNGLNLNYSWFVNAANINTGYYKIRVTAYDTGNLSSFGFSNVFYMDNQFPYVIFVNPSGSTRTIFTENTTVFIAFDVIDDNALYGYYWNLTYSNGTVYNLSFNNLTSTLPKIYSHYTELDLIGFPNGNWSIGVTAADAHTDKNMKEARRIIKEKDSLNFVFDRTSINIKAIDAISSDFALKTDRYSFDFAYTGSSGLREYEIRGNNIEYLKKSKYKGHFVIDSLYWIDFEGQGDVSVEEQKDDLGAYYKVYVKTDGSAKQASFNSLGMLNIASYSNNFSIAGTTPVPNAYEMAANALAAANFYNAEVLDTKTTPGVFLFVFLFLIFIFMVFLTESIKIIAFGIMAGIYGFFIGLLIFGTISAVAGVILIVISLMYIIRCFAFI